MRALGFNFNKISIEKLSNKVEELKISTNINIIDITSVKADLIKTKDEFVSIKFEYTINYEPDYAKLEFSGDILLEVESKMVKEVLKDWKNKEIPEEFKVFVFNLILIKSNIKGLELEEDMNLPLHIPLPSIQLPSKESKEKKSKE